MTPQAPSHRALPDTGDRVLTDTQDCVLPPPPEPPPVVRPPPEPIKAATRLTIPQLRVHVSTPSPTPHRSLLDGVTYTIPLEKGRSRTKTVDCFPQGSLSDPGILIHPASPTTPFEFPFPLIFDDPTPLLTDDHDTHRPRWTASRVSLACHGFTASAVTKIPMLALLLGSTALRLGRPRCLLQL